MTDADERIDRVLAGLREADAPSGMEGRILRAMVRAEREPVRAGNSMRNWMTRPALALAGVGALALLVALAVTSLRRPADLVSSQGVAAVGSRHGADQAGAVPQRLRPGGCGEGYGKAEAVPSSSAGLSGRARESDAGEVRVEPADSSEVLPVDQEALAVSEMLAPSKPAPPLPLTHQEKMLAQVVHQGEPEELATLRPDVREKQMELSRAEFQEFFEPLPVKDNE
jgi:hypothetical protein